MYPIDNILGKIIDIDIRASNNGVLLLGDAGVGKTSVIKALDDGGLTTKVFTLQANELQEKGDLNGVRLVPHGDTYRQEFFPHQVIQQAQEFAVANPKVLTIVLYDEINRTEADATSAMLSTVTSRVCGNINLADNIRFIATGNDTGNVTAMDDASLTRFAIYKVYPTAQRFLEIQEGLNPWVRDTLTQHPELILEKVNKDAEIDAEAEDDGSFNASFGIDAHMEPMEAFTNPRTLESISRWLNEASNDFLIRLMQTRPTPPSSTGNPGRDMLTSTIESHIGRTKFAALLTERIADDLLQSQSTGSNNTASSSVAQPMVWPTLMKLNTPAEIENKINELDDDEVMAVVLYAATHDHRRMSAILDAALSIDKIGAIPQNSRGTLSTVIMANQFTDAARDIINRHKDLDQQLAKAMVDHAAMLGGNI